MSLTKRQSEVLGFIEGVREREGVSPSLREIAAHFGFKSMNAAADHVRALVRKGVLRHVEGRARSWRGMVEGIPILGDIPAGRAASREGGEKQGCLEVDLGGVGVKRTARTFALEVRGDSMVGRHIVEGDYVVLEHGRTPRPGDVVAALIDNENTLKTYRLERGKPFLQAENPKYPNLIPAEELVIQGVMVALVRKCE